MPSTNIVTDLYGKIAKDFPLSTEASLNAIDEIIVAPLPVVVFVG